MPRTKKITRLSVTNSDVDALREHYAATFKPAHVNPAKGLGTISAQDLHVSIDEFDVWKGGCSSGMSVSFTESPDLFAVYLPIAGAMEFKGRGATHVSTPGSMLICDFAKTEQIILHENRKHIGIGFSRKMVIRQLSEFLEVPVDRDFELSCELPVDHDSGYLASLCRLLGDSIESNPEAAAAMGSNKLLLRATLMRLLESVPHQYSHLMNRRQSPALPRHVKRAIDFMMAHAQDPLTIDEIASAAGVSVRTLQVAFQQFRNTTPLHFFRQLRLEKAREQMIAQKGDTVLISAIARRWGFSNVGRFSLLYLASFGETPRQTLSRGS